MDESLEGRQRRDERDLALQKRGEMCAAIYSAEVPVCVSGEIEWIEKQYVIIQDVCIWIGVVWYGLQEFAPRVWR